MARISMKQEDYEILSRTVLDFMPHPNASEAEWEPLNRENTEAVRNALQIDRPPVFGTIEVELPGGAMQTLNMLWDVASETEPTIDEETWKRVHASFWKLRVPGSRAE